MTRRVILQRNDKFDPEIARDVLDGTAVVEVIDDKTVEGVIAAAQDADGLISLTFPLTSQVLARLESISVIGVPGTGVSGVDVAAAEANDIVVVNAPTYAVDEVSTHAMALLLACARSLPRFDAGLRAGQHGRDLGAPLHRLRGRTLGLVAFGDIARRTAEKASGFGLEIIAYDPYVDAETMADHGVESVSFDELLARSELLSVHAPRTEETRGLLDADAFAAMGEGTIVVNTGRGSVIAEEALLDALDNGTVAMAGLDVFEVEPLGDSPLREREDVILTPHIAWYSEESREDAIRSVAEDIRRVLQNREPRGRLESGTPWLNVDSDEPTAPVASRSPLEER